MRDAGLRGEVLDIYPPGDEDAVRIVFGFDTVEDIRHFDPISQSSTDSLEQFNLIPVREILWTDARIDALERRLTKGEGAEQLIEELRETRACPNEELYFPMSFDAPGSLTDYLSDASTLFLVDPERLDTGAQILARECSELYTQARTEVSRDGASKRPLPRPDELLMPLDPLIEGRKRRILFPSIKDPDATQRIQVPCDGARSFFGNVAFLREELGNLIQAGYEVTIFSESESQGLRIEHLLREFPVEINPMSVSAGFTLPELKITVIQENEIFGRRRRIPASVKKAKSRAIDTFVELAPGDFVVHVNYGIGKFLGIERITAAGTERDYIRLEYAGEEMVFIPIEQVNLIQRYIGQEGREPRLDRMGGKSWENRKDRVRRSVEDLAHRLVELYARRKTARGFGFPPDTDWQLEFEAAFPYEETEDQLRCIEEVKTDMESPRPMDRLLCGDVGYGKTEVAIRAAFKVVADGKQVAVLAPTTVLVFQHFQTFRRRLAAFPVRIEMLSRLRNRKEQKQTLDELEAGKVDIVIGTHRLLSRDVRFHDLGLLVVDEEQRFGVSHKERLKEMRKNVDVLTMSATPIPRTLHMSIAGLRDMSAIETPPRGRLSIQTVVAPFDEDLVRRAIEHEIERGGQVFFVHNRVQSIPTIAEKVRQLVPRARIVVGHGQMHERQLEEVMLKFVRHEADVLVCTTIIENGLDISRANTIIINRADRFGMAELYQLRGRVGRSDQRAYAYLLVPPAASLSSEARQRLAALKEFSELGAGFRIAALDLELRGAGNLLGREQHGYINAVGFDLYCRMLEQAVARLKGEATRPEVRVTLNLGLDVRIPPDYIPGENARLRAYKRIAAIGAEREREDVVRELEDRFGPPPRSVLNLVEYAGLKSLCEKMLVSTVERKNHRLALRFHAETPVRAERLVRVVRSRRGASLDPSGVLWIEWKPEAGSPAAAAQGVLLELQAGG